MSIRAAIRREAVLREPVDDRERCRAELAAVLPVPADTAWDDLLGMARTCADRALLHQEPTPAGWPTADELIQITDIMTVINEATPHTPLLSAMKIAAAIIHNRRD